MNRMGATRDDVRGRNGELDDPVAGECNEPAVGHDVMRVLRAGENLVEDGDRGCDEGNAVDSETADGSILKACSE
jgi:hypothetical protein